MDRIPLTAQDRLVLGKKVNKLRREGFTPAHVFGNKTDGEIVSVITKDFLKVLAQAGETGLINLKIGDDRVRPVLIRDVTYGPLRGEILHIDFYQVDLKQKTQVPVPVEIIGEEAESTHLGETIVLQVLSEIQIEALPDDLIEKIEVDQSVLKVIDDAITVADLVVDRSRITILTPEEEVVIKMAPAVTKEMEALLEEADAEAAAAAESAEEAEAGEDKTEEGTEEANEEATETPQAAEEKSE
jgi:large subunit ribosomal protein L25